MRYLCFYNSESFHLLLSPGEAIETNSEHRECRNNLYVCINRIQIYYILFQLTINLYGTWV